MPGKAVFFDRDGVLNQLVLNPKTGEFESPHKPDELALAEGLGPLLKSLQDAGFSLFLVSNQPSFAKGKCSMEDLQGVHNVLDFALKSQGVHFKEYYYCYHHPESLVEELKGPCPCRKPSPFYIETGLSSYELEKTGSYMVGDQDTDIECGKAAGLRTIQIEAAESARKRGDSAPDARAADLKGAVDIILNFKE